MVFSFTFETGETLHWLDSQIAGPTNHGRVQEWRQFFVTWDSQSYKLKKKIEAKAKTLQ